jgi:hypothetical protein
LKSNEDLKIIQKSYGVKEKEKPLQIDTTDLVIQKLSIKEPTEYWEPSATEIAISDASSKTKKKKNENIQISENTLNSIFPVRNNSRLYVNQTALIYQLAKSKLVINMKSKKPIISSNKRVNNNDRSSNKTLLNNNSQSRSVAKITVHVLNRN